MAINICCKNSKCKHYYEELCMVNLEEKYHEIDKEGKCKSFEYGVNEGYYDVEYPSEN